MDNRAPDEPETEGCPAETSEAGRADICKGCPGRELCQSQAGPDSMQPAIDIRMKAIKHKILVLSGKGGVGKSSLAASLAVALSMKHGQKSAILDTDICGPSVVKLMNVEGESVVNTPYGWKPLISPNGSVKVMSVAALLDTSQTSVIFRGPRKTQLIKQLLKDTFWGRLDYLIIDTPPGTSDEHLSVVKCLQHVQPDGALIVTTPQQMSLVTVRREIQFCRAMKIRILGLVENMAGFTCPCCKEVSELFKAGGAAKLCEEFGIQYLGSVPLDQDFVQCCEQGGNVFKKQEKSATIIRLLGVVQKLVDKVTDDS